MTRRLCVLPSPFGRESSSSAGSLRPLTAPSLATSSQESRRRHCGGTLSEQTTENGVIADSYEAVLVAAEISSVIMIISSALLVCSFLCALASLSLVSFSSSSTWLRFARTCISGCQRCHATERASPAFDDNIVRYVNSPVAHDAVPAQHDLLLFLGGVPFAPPAPTKIIRFFRLRNLTFKIGLVGIGNTVQRGTLHV